MAAVTSESMCAARESTVKARGDRGNVRGAGAFRQCLLSFSCSFNQAVSVTGLAALETITAIFHDNHTSAVLVLPGVAQAGAAMIDLGNLFC